MKKALLFVVLLFLIVLAGGLAYWQYALSQKLPSPSSSEAEATISKSDGHSRIVKEKLTDQDIVVTVVHDRSSTHSLNDVFQPEADTHLEVRLADTSYSDGPSTLLLSENFTQVKSLPFSFAITGDLEKTFAGRRELTISARVLRNKGSKAVMGDLISESVTTITPQAKQVEIKVFGLERCGSPNSGGFCTNRETL
jgi:hypothetical protein